MLTLKFPKMEKALTKAKDGLKPNSPRLKVLVVDQHAIVLGDFMCLVCNIYDYFTIHDMITDEKETQSLKEILRYMNGKSFTAKYWEELTKGASFMVSDNKTLYIETPSVKKELHYQDEEVDVLPPLRGLLKASEQEQTSVPTISMNYKSLRIIKDCFGTILDKQGITFSFSGQSKRAKFTFTGYKFIYGYIHTDYNAANEGFLFEDLNEFAQNQKPIVIALEKKQEEQAIPAPPQLGKEVSEGLFAAQPATQPIGDFVNEKPKMKVVKDDEANIPPPPPLADLEIPAPPIDDDLPDITNFEEE